LGISLLYNYIITLLSPPQLNLLSLGLASLQRTDKLAS
jgi:hypothetical protein